MTIIRTIEDLRADLLSLGLTNALDRFGAPVLNGTYLKIKPVYVSRDVAIEILLRNLPNSDFEVSVGDTVFQIELVVSQTLPDMFTAHLKQVVETTFEGQHEDWKYRITETKAGTVWVMRTRPTNSSWHHGTNVFMLTTSGDYICRAENPNIKMFSSFEDARNEAYRFGRFSIYHGQQ